MLDVTVTHPQCQANVQRLKAGKATLGAEQRKHSKYDALYRREGIVFIPIAFDSNGAVGEEALAFLKQLASKAVARNPDMDWAVSAPRSGWVQHLCLVVQRELARNMFDLLGLCKGGELNPHSVFGLDTPQWFARSKDHV